MGGGAKADSSGYPSKQGMDPLLKIVLLSSAGSVLEWMDFSVYAFLALEIGRAFFPAGDATVHLLQTFSIHAVAFIVRPLGGLLFGHIGDVYGKKLALQSSLFLMALATTLMGTLPTYDRIGLAAPCLLAIFRVLQGLAVGGQLVGTMVYVDHHAPVGHKGYYGGITLAGGALGVLLGSLEGALIVAVCTPQQLRTFGFRLPFLLGFLVAIAGMALHKQAPEVEEPVNDPIDAADEDGGEKGPTAGVQTPKTVEMAWGRGESSEDQSAPIVDKRPEAAEAEGKEGRRERGRTTSRGVGTQVSPLGSLLRHHKGELFLAFLVATLWCTAFYIMYVWISSFLSHLTHPPVENALFINSFWLLVLTLALPYGGHLADKYGVHRMMLVGSVYVMLASPVCFHIFQRGAHRAAAAFFGQALITPGLVMAGGPLTAYLTGYATTSRATYTAVALIYNLAQATFGGTALLVATALADSAHGLGAGLWVSFTALLCIVALLIDPRARALTRCKGRQKELAHETAEAAVARV